MIWQKSFGVTKSTVKDYGYSCVSNPSWGINDYQHHIISPTVQRWCPLLLIFSAGLTHPADVLSDVTDRAKAEINRDGLQNVRTVIWTPM